MSARQAPCHGAPMPQKIARLKGEPNDHDQRHHVKAEPDVVVKVARGTR